ncbi:hypothetical protein [uncultured Chitinophaga sp.]|jgi:hypothetical protein|uniref:hypothetical protein n=1 Tax=uncultured Chitinophaga sp. TaxID=339340 RepID=UPI0026206C4D|nr:hypothetical protein [uncultured Chitinophaga sp.]
MKKTRILMLLAGVALFASCKKDEEQAPADVAISGTWNKVSEYRTITQSGRITKDTVFYPAGSHTWTFDLEAGKIYRLKDTQADTLFYKLIEENKKIVTAVDGDFIFELDTLPVLQLDKYYLKTEGHYTTPFTMDVISNFAR